MVDSDQLLNQERRLWNADADDYRDVLADDAVMVFPAPTGVLDRDAVLDSLGDGDRWRTLDVHDERVLKVDDDVVQVVYEADAERAADGSAYRALASSTYRRDGDDWLLVSHQQTPLDD
jgi:ketosteroid isomerase-like protein